MATPGQLCDFGNRLDIHHERPGRTVRANAKAALGNFAAQRNYGRTLTGAGSGQTDVRGLNSEAFHEVKDADLRFHGRVGNRRALQAIAQCLVVDHDPGRPLGAAWSRCQTNRG